MDNVDNGLAWLGFWLMLGLWNVNIDIEFEKSDLDEVIFSEQFLKGNEDG